MTIHLGKTSLLFSCNRPRKQAPDMLYVFSIWSCSKWGLPMPCLLPTMRCALTTPFHPYPKAVIFCGTFPEVSLARRYLALLSGGARTFLCNNAAVICSSLMQNISSLQKSKYDIQGIVFILRVNFMYHLLLIFFLIVPSLFANASSQNLNILIWSGTIDPKLIEKFQKETGIAVTVNLLDSDESIESKLLTGEAGFDIITPTLSPFYLRQMELGLFRPITVKEVPNLSLILPEIKEMFTSNGLSLENGVPLSWGSVGFVYNKEKIAAALGKDKLPINSWALIYNKKNIEKLSNCGVQLLDDPLEVFLSIYHYLGKGEEPWSKERIDALTDRLFDIFPYVKKFDSSADSIVSAIASEKYCVIQCFSGEAIKAIHTIEKQGKKSPYAYVEPVEGFSTWLDMIVIPKGATNPENAYKFINFLLDPKNAAINYQYSLQPATVKGFEKFLDPELRKKVKPFPIKHGRKTFGLNHLLDFRRTKRVSNAWLRLRLGIQ